MKKGQLVRKMLPNGTPIGPWIRVTKCTRHWVHGEVIGLKDVALLTRERTYAPKMPSIIISEKMFDRIIEGKTICVMCSASDTCKKKLIPTPDIVRFYTYLQMRECVFTVENVQETVSLFKPYLRITLHARLL